MLRDSWLAIGCVIAAGAISVVALTSALWGVPKHGLYGQEGGVVTDVFPGGPLWRYGVRPGQRLLMIDSGEHQEDWRVAVDMGVPTTVTEGQMIGDLRATVPVAVASAVVAVLALLVLTFSATGAVALAAAAVVLTEHSSMATGVPATSSALAAVALVAPAVWFFGWGGRRGWAALALIMASLVAGAWVVSRFVSPTYWEPLEPVRVAATYLSLVVLLLVAGGREVSAVAGGYDRRRRTDVAVLAVTAAVTALLANRARPSSRCSWWRSSRCWRIPSCAGDCGW